MPAPPGTRSVPDVAERVAAVRARLERAARRAGREPAQVRLVAVSKLHPARAVRAAAAAGLLDVGESRAQELRAKQEALSDLTVRWHFVGRLQRNKVPDVVGRVVLVHSVDRVELAEALAERAAREEVAQDVLVQVNVGGDPAKAGVAVAEAGKLVAAVARSGALRCRGLMTVPPLGEDPRPVFARLRALRDDLRREHPDVQELSMGMSNDAEVAVEEGATIVRIGEAVFGPRPSRR